MKFRLPVFFITFFATLVSPAWAQEVPTLVVERPPNLKITDLGRMISALFGVTLIIAGLLSFFYLLFGGLQWITSGGDKPALEAARNKIIHAIVGLVIVFSAWALMLLIQSFLGIQLIGHISLPQPF